MDTIQHSVVKQLLIVNLALFFMILSLTYCRHLEIDTRKRNAPLRKEGLHSTWCLNIFPENHAVLFLLTPTLEGPTLSKLLLQKLSDAITIWESQNGFQIVFNSAYTASEPSLRFYLYKANTPRSPWCNDGAIFGLWDNSLNTSILFSRANSASKCLFWLWGSVSEFHASDSLSNWAKCVSEAGPPFPWWVQTIARKRRELGS